MSVQHKVVLLAFVHERCLPVNGQANDIVPYLIHNIDRFPSQQRDETIEFMDTITLERVWLKITLHKSDK